MGWHKEFAFTHIWCHRNVSTAQYRLLRKHQHLPIIYDIDDLLTADPDFVKDRPRIVERIRWCLESRAHRHHLHGHAEIAPVRYDPTGKIIILKNGHLGDDLPPRSVQKKIVWTSGDHPFVLRDIPEVAGELGNIANKHDYEMTFIGRFDTAIGERFKRQRHIQKLDVHSYREFLRSCSGAIGLAPLPSGLSAHNQRFFDAKSDIKLLDYTSNGMIPVCTNTPPYARSEFYIPELGANDPDELLRKLDICIQDHAGWLERLDRTFHGSGALDQRRYIDLSHNPDSIFNVT